MIGNVLRRVVVTPTFAAGLGVVVAALLAFHMGVPSFRVSVPHWSGQRCSAPGCASARGHPGTAVKSGQPLPTPAPADTAGSRSSSGGTSAPPGQAPTVTYQTRHTWPGSFQGSLTISFAGHVPGHWWLRFTYPEGHIQRVWGPVRWQPRGDHIAVVGTPASGRHTAAGRDIEVWFQVSGHAGRPHVCSINHLACRVR
jgi:hypothetical protein